jgi:hypothetical protein
MYNELEKLQLDLASYREAIDHVFSSTLTTPGDWRQCLLEILICSSQLYVDYLLVVKLVPALETVSSKRGMIDLIETNSLRESSLRKKLRQQLESSPCGFISGGFISGGFISGRRTHSPNPQVFAVCKITWTDLHYICPRYMRKHSELKSAQKASWLITTILHSHSSS